MWHLMQSLPMTNDRSAGRGNRTKLRCVLKSPAPVALLRLAGVLLIETLCASWGSTPTPDGKVVWVTLWMPR